MRREIKNYRGYIEQQEQYLKKVIKEIDNGALAKGKAKSILDEIERPEIINEPVKLINRLLDLLPESQLTKSKKTYSEKHYKKEVILSEFFS